MMRYATLFVSESTMLIRVASLLCSVLASLVLSSWVSAEPVQIRHDGLRLNANYENDDAAHEKPVMVILHGTWMHHDTELPTYLQDLATYEGYSSLNLSLSLGIDDRKSFMNCETMPVVGSHQQAVEELKAWFDWLGTQGHTKFVLIAHSRGGAQASLFYQTYHYPGLERLALIAPATYEQARVTKSFENRYGKSLAEQVSLFQGLDNQVEPITEAAVLYCTFAKVSAEAFLSYYLPTPNKHTPSLIAKIDIPTQIFLGSEDPLSDRLMEYQSEFINNPLISTHLIEGADHFFRDLYSDELFEAILDDL